MALHQPRHRRHAASLDYFGAPGVKLAAVARHCADTPAFNQQVRGKSSVAAAVPNPAIPDDRSAHAVLLRRATVLPSTTTRRRSLDRLTKVVPEYYSRRWPSAKRQGGSPHSILSPALLLRSSL